MAHSPPPHAASSLPRSLTGSVGDGATVSFDVVVPAGTTYARFSLFDANTTAGSDLDMRVFWAGRWLARSGSGTSD